MKRPHILASGTLAFARALALALAGGLAGCGQLEVPDLHTGAVQGTVASVTASGGYVYVLGAPHLKASLDASGSYQVDRAPVGAIQMVVVAAAGGQVRAEIASVVVSSQTTTRLDRDAALMALAGRIVTAVKPSGGSLADSARFTVVGTIHQGVAGPGAVLAGLPAGPWMLTTAMAGFRPHSAEKIVLAGSDTLVDETIEVDDADDRRGCLSSSCGSGLHCNPTDGRCYACLADADCHAGEHCDSGVGGSRTCVAAAMGTGAFCDSADADGKCAHGVRVLTSGGFGYCSVACASAGDPACPAGWGCDLADGLCKVPRNCLETAEAQKASCAKDAACTTDLAGGKCLRPQEDQAGFCSAPCTADQQCSDAGFGAWTCQIGPDGVKYCQKP